VKGCVRLRILIGRMMSRCRGNCTGMDRVYEGRKKEEQMVTLGEDGQDDDCDRARLRDDKRLKESLVGKAIDSLREKKCGGGGSHVLCKLVMIPFSLSLSL
jgi:hypothetical protein